MTSSAGPFSAVETARRIRHGEMNCKTAVEMSLQWIKDANPHLNALTTIFEEQALLDADSLDKVGVDGPLGPLHGVPITIKDNVDQRGAATTQGVRAFRDMVATEDSPAVANLRRAGAIIVGRTNVPAFSLRSHTDNDLFGPTLNPWSAEHTPGGSSGGAAASVAAGMTPLAHANDYGGSIRYPAHCCGLFGLKPGFGRVPHFNPSAPAERSLTLQMFLAQGALARSAADLRLALRALEVGDFRDPFWSPASLAPPKMPSSVRVAIPRSFSPTPLSPSVAEAIERAAAAISSAGYAVEYADVPSFEAASNLWARLAWAETRALTLPVIDKYADAAGQFVIKRNLANAAELDLEQYMRAWSAHVALKRKWLAFLQDFPLVLAPVSTQPPEKLGFDVDPDESRWAEHVASTRFLRSVNLLGLPSVTVPCGMAGPVPVAVQLIGAPSYEDVCIDAAEAIEARSGFRMLVSSAAEPF